MRNTSKKTIGAYTTGPTLVSSPRFTLPTEPDPIGTIFTEFVYEQHTGTAARALVE